jgi:chitin disaccharide deacetylase
MRRLLLLLTAAVRLGAQPPQASLVERLGLPAGSKVLIINADDAGLLHAENLATIEAMKTGLVGSSTVMTPSPWFPEMVGLAQANPQFDFGVHLTFTSEWQGFRYGPVLGAGAVPSLVDKQGYLLPSVAAFHANATPADVEAEGRAQIQRALAAGLDVSHLDMHMHVLGLDPRFFESYLRLATEFDLPIRFIPPSEELRRAQADRLRKAGIIFQDRIIVGADQAPGETLQDYWRRKLRQLVPGVTELYVHLSLDQPELRAMTGDAAFRTGWRDRVEEARIFTSDPELRRIVEAEGVKLLRWKDLRDLQRRERKAAEGK